ncbi:MAG: hypothetical protein RLZZ338_2644 [Cyanobacteriota bacterium]|jgi:micrococcal nuclease
MKNFTKFLSPSLKNLTLITYLLILVGCGITGDKNSYTVKRVSDGDTLSAVNAKGEEIQVRFACIDAPEIPHSKADRESKNPVDQNQFNWGEKAYAKTQELVKKGRDRVNLTQTDVDQYGRKVSEVRLPDGTFLQEVLLKEGLAMVYRPYLKKCPSREIMEKAEAEAKKQKKGVWSDKKFVPAWQFRKDHK